MNHKSNATPEVATDVDSEEALVAACLVGPRNFDILGDTISGRDFFNALHGAIFDILRDIHLSGKPANDPKVILPILRSAKLPVGESESIAAIIAKYLGEGVPNNAKFYANRIISCSQLRRLAALGRELSHRAADPNEDAAELVAIAEAQVQCISQAKQSPALQADAIAKELLSELDEQLKAGKPRGVPSGLPSFDLSAGAFMPGELTILAAGPGSGKSALAMQIAEHSADRGRRVLVASLEMRGSELIGRTLCKLAGVNSRDVRAGNIDDNERTRLQDAAESLRGVPLEIWAPPSATTAQMRAVAKLNAATRGLSLFVLDYVGLVAPTDSRLKRYEQIAQITRDLKALAKELQIPVLALAQLNREAGDAEPKLSNLAESSALERDADTVLFLHRDPTTPKQTNLIIAKHRFGTTGRLTLGWDAVATTFYDGSNSPMSVPAMDAEDAAKPNRSLQLFNEGSF